MKPEIERILLELCERVAGARARYHEFRRVEDTILGVSSLAKGLGNAKKYREAKELLGDLIREQAMAEDHLWRKLVEGAAEELQGMMTTERNFIRLIVERGAQGNLNVTGSMLQRAKEILGPN